jgi:hypothetical protein
MNRVNTFLLALLLAAPDVWAQTGSDHHPRMKAPEMDLASVLAVVAISLLGYFYIRRRSFRQPS